MARGQPDFGMYAPKTTVGSLSDMAELAARLGSIDTFDRRGDVVWYDDFEDNLSRWMDYGDGTGHAHVLSADTSYHGGLCCKLTTGSDGERRGGMYHSVFLPYPSKVGFEVTVSKLDTIEYFSLLHSVFTRTARWEGHIKWVRADASVQYLDVNNNWQTLETGLTLGAEAQVFHTVKLVTDISTKKYVRLLLDDNSYDLSAYSMRTVLGVDQPGLLSAISAVGPADSNENMYVDNVIITQNES